MVKRRTCLSGGLVCFFWLQRRSVGVGCQPGAEGSIEVGKGRLRQSQSRNLPRLHDAVSVCSSRYRDGRRRRLAMIKSMLLLLLLLLSQDKRNQRRE